MFWVFVVLTLVLGSALGLKNITVPVTDSAWEYSGQWYIPTKKGCNDETLKFTNATGGFASFTFTGTAAYLQTTFAFDRGLVRVEIDGESGGDLNSWLDDPTKQLWECRTLFSRTGLSNSQHTLKATLVDKHDGVAKFEMLSFIYTQLEPQDITQSPDPPATSTQPPSESTEKQSTTRTPSSQSFTSSLPSSTFVSKSSASTSLPTSVTSPPPPWPSSDILAEVSVDDPRIRWAPPEAWENPGPNVLAASCPISTRATNNIGATVTFSFKGKAVSIKTIGSASSGVYTINMDGKTIGTQDNFQLSESNTCDHPILYNVTGLSDIDHILLLTLTGASNATGNTGGTRLEVAGFSYAGSSASSTLAPSQSEPSTNNTALIGGTVGGVIGVLILAAIATFLFLRQKSRRARKDQFARHGALGSGIHMGRLNGSGEDFSSRWISFLPEMQNGDKPLPPSRQTGSPAITDGSSHPTSHSPYPYSLFHFTPEQGTEATSPTTLTHNSPALSDPVELAEHRRIAGTPGSGERPIRQQDGDGGRTALPLGTIDEDRKLPFPKSAIVYTYNDDGVALH